MLLVLAALLLAGCGGDDEEPQTPGTFDSGSYPFSFNYPTSWAFNDSPQFEYGSANAKRSVAVQLSPPDNQIVVSEYELSRSLAAGENAPEAEIDAVVEKLETQTGGRATRGKTVQYGGAPGYEYVIRFKNADGQRLRSRLIYLFKDRSEFEINCQSNRDGRNEVDAACDQVLNSLKFTD